MYTERITSGRTTALFLALMLLCGLLVLWRLTTTGLDGLAVVGLVGFGLFLFYVLNFRTLALQLSQQALTLTFGVFTWVVPVSNMAACALDEPPALMRFGGAGIHFMLVRGRYRASFNFLEYPRVVIAFRRSVGPVRDISFSTRRPEAVIQRLQRALAAAPRPAGAR